MSLRGRVVTGLMVSSTAMTLMACYGAPCIDGNCYGGFDTGTGGSDTGNEEGECNANAEPEQTLETTLPVSVEGVLEAQGGTNQGSCGGYGDEVVYMWEPPVLGDFLVSVVSDADTVLYLRSPDASGTGSCGTEIACNDDENAGTKNPSMIVNVTSSPVLIVVDTFNAEEAGTFTLTIEAQ